MQVNQVLTSQKLVWVIHIQVRTSSASGIEVLLVELGCHLAPNLDALNPSEETLLLQIQPVCLVQFWSNQKVQVLNSLVFSD